MLSEETLLLVKQYASWILPSGLGVYCKLQFESENRNGKEGKKITFRRILRSLTIGITVGYVADAFCEYKEISNYFRGSIILGSALISEYLMQLIFEKNGKNIKDLLLDFLRSIISKFSKTNSEGGNNV